MYIVYNHNDSVYAPLFADLGDSRGADVFAGPARGLASVARVYYYCYYYYYYYYCYYY